MSYRVGRDVPYLQRRTTLRRGHDADIRKGDEAEEIFRFIDFWRRQYGRLPQHLVFDTKLTTYDRLDAAGITFITLRRRSPSALAEIDSLPASAWRTVTLEISNRKHRTPRVYEHKARPHKRDFRQFFITDLGHGEPHHPAHQRRQVHR